MSSPLCPGLGLPVTAEALLRLYPTATKAHIDTLAWLTNAIGSTGMARYKYALREVDENSEFRKLRKYAAKNLSKLADEDVVQYQQGMFDQPMPDYTL